MNGTKKGTTVHWRACWTRNAIHAASPTVRRPFANNPHDGPDDAANERSERGGRPGDSAAGSADFPVGVARQKPGAAMPGCGVAITGGSPVISPAVESQCKDSLDWEQTAAAARPTYSGPIVGGKESFEGDGGGFGAFLPSDYLDYSSARAPCGGLPSTPACGLL
jgi:hypothetical protein